MQGETIHFNDGEKDIRAYLSPSKTGSGPGIIVVQEWWGLVPHIMDVTDRFAEAGFTALAPDLYGGESTTDPDDAATLMQALGIAETELILRKAIETLLAHPATVPNDKVGIVGFCMGGQLAMFAAGNNPQVQATVCFYGIHPKVLPSYRDLNGPVLGIFAENDHMATPEAVTALDRELTLLEKEHTFITYTGVDHAFFNDTRPEVYNAEAAADAWAKTIEFFNANLR
jgi:carboxymethylenebutenolidase